MEGAVRIFKYTQTFRIHLLRVAAVAAAFVALGAVSAAHGEVVTTEPATDRYGSDYKGFDLASPDPALCAKACAEDTKCKAYTYVKPGVQGPAPRCYLKDPAPAASANECCVSGVKKAVTARRPPPAKSAAKPATPVDPSVTVINPGVLAIKVDPVDPGPLGRGQAQGSLNGKNPSQMPQCSQGAVSKTIFDIFDKIAGFFGGELKRGAHCGSYKREIAAGVTVNPAPSNLQYPQWDYLGGRGDKMSDAALCLIKDIGAAPGGAIERSVNVSIAAAGSISLRQRVGLKSFDAEEKRAEIYNQIRICAPIMGCLDAQRQDLTAIIRKSAPAWPGGMRAGDFPIRDSYSLEVSTQWADSSFSAKLPPITVVTPYGDATVQPGFSYFSSLYPIDTPFSKQQGAGALVSHPNAISPYAPRMQDLYGRSGAPFVLNLISHLPQTFTEQPDDWPEGVIFQPQATGPARAEGWTSQLAFGSRNGVYNKSPWAPNASELWPLRPDINLDEPRSMIERQPTANFVAEAPITFSPPGSELMKLIPPGASGLINDIKLEIVVKPRFAADYAAQLGIMEREGKIKDCQRSGEFTTPCGLAESLLYTQARAEGRADIVTTIRLLIDFNFSTPFFDPDIEFSDSFPIPLGGPNTSYDPGKPSPGADPYSSFARASVISSSPSKDIASIVRGLSGQSTSDLNGWVAQCLKTPPKNVSVAPEPSYEPGSADDLKPDLLPCNICVAELRQDKYAPFYIPSPKVTAHTYPESQSWSCQWQEHTGCFDLCRWEKGADGKTRFTTAVRSAVEVVGDRCKTPPPPIIK